MIQTCHRLFPVPFLCLYNSLFLLFFQAICNYWKENTVLFRNWHKLHFTTKKTARCLGWNLVIFFFVSNFNKNKKAKDADAFLHTFLHIFFISRKWPKKITGQCFSIESEATWKHWASARFGGKKNIPNGTSHSVIPKPFYLNCCWYKCACSLRKSWSNEG